MSETDLLLVRKAIIDIATKAVQAEREACAAIAKEFADEGSGNAHSIYLAIRNRGKEGE